MSNRADLQDKICSVRIYVHSACARAQNCLPTRGRYGNTDGNGCQALAVALVKKNKPGRSWHNEGGGEAPMPAVESRWTPTSLNSGTPSYVRVLIVGHAQPPARQGHTYPLSSRQHDRSNNTSWTWLVSCMRVRNTRADDWASADSRETTPDSQVKCYKRS